jgi:hypothetical protein
MEFATPENLKKYGLNIPEETPAPTPTVAGTQTVKQPAEVPSLLRLNHPETVQPAPCSLVLGTATGEQLVQDEDQSEVTQGEVRVRDKSGKKFLAR